jgi:hypothetical protein
MDRKVILFRRLTGEWAICSPEGFCIMPGTTAAPGYESYLRVQHAAAVQGFNVIGLRGVGTSGNL